MTDSVAWTNNEAQTFTDPTTQTWYDYNPTNNISDLSGPVAPLSASDFENLTGAGIFIQNVTAAAVNGNNFNIVELKEFQTTAIPEPSAWLLSLGAILLGLRFRRQR